MRIVVLDGYTLNPGDLSWECLAKFGDLKVYDRTENSVDVIVSRIGDAEIVFTNKTPLGREVFEACNIKYIGVLATGYNIVDVAAAKERGIVVTNIPTYGTDSVAQFAIAMLLEITSQVGHHVKRVKEGAWAKNPDWCFWETPLIELAGKTMGIIGYGRIGKQTGKIASALGMNIIAYNGEGKTGESFVSLDELLKNSDVIALHCPLTSETENIINRESISKMKDGVIILNNSRGQLIVEEDLAEALNSGKVLGAGLDVVRKEPIDENNPLLKAKNVFITPHMSWAPVESRKRLLEIAVENLEGFLQGNIVNEVKAV